MLIPDMHMIMRTKKDTYGKAKMPIHLLKETYNTDIFGFQQYIKKSLKFTQLYMSGNRARPVQFTTIFPHLATMVLDQGFPRTWWLNRERNESVEFLRRNQILIIKMLFWDLKKGQLKVCGLLACRGSTYM